MPDRSIAPQIKDAVDFQFTLPQIQQHICNNDLPLYFYQGGSQDVIQIDWVFQAGIWAEQKTAVANAVAAIYKNGTTLQSELEINEALEFYGASLKVTCGNDYTTFTLHCLSKHLPALLPVIFEILTQPAFAEKELEIYKQNTIQAMRIKLLNCDFVANRHIEAALFSKEHPYGRYAEIADIEALHRQDLLDYFHANFASDLCTMFVAGKYTDSALALIQEVFGKEKWNQFATKKTIEIKTINPSADKHFKLINNEEGVQAALRVARHFVPRSHPDFIPMQVLNTLLGGYFGSRLMSNIREEKGYTYGIYSYIAPYKHASMMMISTEVGRAVAQASITEIWNEMEGLKNETIENEELLLVKNYMLGSLLSDMEGPFAIMRLWKNLILNKEAIEHFNQRVAAIKTVQAKDLQALAQKYFVEEDFFQVVVV